MITLKQTIIGLVTLLVVGAITFIIWQWPTPNRLGGPKAASPATRESSEPITTQQSQPPSTATFAEALTQIPVDSRLGVQQLYQMAKEAKLYKFDPQITGYRKETTPRGEDYIMVGTPTHVAQLLDGKLIKLASLYDGSDTRRKPEAMNEWYQATARLTEQEAIQEVLAILRRLGDTNTLNAVQGGTHEFRATPITVKTPDGQRVRLIPFPTVELRDTNNRTRITVEFRMGPTGILGVTEWFSM